MDIKLDSAEMREVLSEALLRAIDEKSREALIAGAIKSLLERQTGGYGTKTSAIEDAFQWAARNVAVKEAQRLLEHDTVFLEKLQAMIADAVKLVTETNREKSVEKLAETLITALLPKERY